MQEYQVKVYPTRTEWYQNGKLHRLDGPAVEEANGTKKWYQNDKRHRLDGPAIEWASGSKEWFQNGLLHRTDGPAVEYHNGTKKWYQNSRLHRTDGPAVECADGTVEYWIDGHYLSYEQFIAKTQPAKELTVAELEKLLGYPVKIVK